ncbi:MAG: hypothetical protein ACFFC7_28580 [Candidatus Hermodarchaeota archaeon]
MNAFFNPRRILTVEASSSIGFPNTLEIWRPEMGFSKSTAQARYHRLLHLQIIHRRSFTNWAKLGLIPLLKIYNRTDAPSEAELLFSNWESPILPEKTIRILVIPERSSFWFKHSARDVYILQGRYSGINISLFNGFTWRGVLYHQLNNSSSPSADIPSPLWKMRFTSVNRFPFVPSDLKLLSALSRSSERQIKYFSSHAGLKDSGYIPKRLKKLRNDQVFQTQFRLYHTGLNERYYVLAVGTASDILPIYKFVHYLPQYSIIKAERCMYALIWLSSEVRQIFLDRCNYLKETLKLEKFYYGLLDPGSKTHYPDLPNLWNENGNYWNSEPED